jgi:hypothetical protein
MHETSRLDRVTIGPYLHYISALYRCGGDAEKYNMRSCIVSRHCAAWLHERIQNDVARLSSARVVTLHVTDAQCGH